MTEDPASLPGYFPPPRSSGRARWRQAAGQKWWEVRPLEASPLPGEHTLFAERIHRCALIVTDRRVIVVNREETTAVPVSQIVEARLARYRSGAAVVTGILVPLIGMGAAYALQAHQPAGAWIFLMCLLFDIVLLVKSVHRRLEMADASSQRPIHVPYGWGDWLKVREAYAAIRLATGHRPVRQCCVENLATP